MKPGIPWSVKGIDHQAREAAKTAARRSGMTLGEWLNTVILDSSAGESPREERREERRPQPRPGDLAIQLGDLAQQLAKLSQREQDTSTRHLEYAPQPQHDIASEILARVESGERHMAEAFTSVNDRLEALNRHIAETPKSITLPNPEDSPAYRALEGALRNVVDHIEVSERRTRDSIKGLQDRMAAMALRAASAENDALNRNAPAISKLETRLATMAERLEKTEAAANRDISSLLHSELAKLTERIEGVKTSSETAIQRAQSAAQTTAQRELREIEGRIHKMLADTQAAMRDNGASQAIQALRGEVEGLAQRFDDLKADAASERDLNSMRLAIEQLSARIAQGPDLRPLADMDRKLAELARRLEQGQGDPKLGNQLSELDKRVRELDRRLIDVQQRGGDDRTRQALEQQLSAIADRITGAEQQLGYISRLDHSISQLYDSFEQNRAWTREVAEEAAGRMAEKLKLSQQAGSSPELMALEQGLAAVRASAAAAEQRNQETLEAVHETLEQIVNRLADMEAQPAAPAQPVFQPEPSYQSARPQAAPALAGLPPEPFFSPAPAPSQSEPRLPEFPAFAQPEPQPVTPNFSALPEEPQEAFPRDDFIAAARRAAQAAAQRQAHPIANGLGLMDKTKTKSSLFKLPGFSGFKRKPARQGPQPVQQTVSRKALIIAGMFLLVAVSAFAVTSLFKEPRSPAPAPAPAVQEQAPKAEPSNAQPPKERPQVEGSMPAPETLSEQPRATKASALASDGMLTGALPAAKQDATLASIVAEPGLAAESAPAGEMPPPEAGPESLRQAAAAGNPAAQFIIASRYLDGRDVEQDLTQAARWYQKAANAGLAPAQYRLATLFERGRGVPQDAATARLWYERAAERGNVKAMHNAAVISAGKQAGDPDYARAAKWFTAAADHGLKDSQFNLAVLYERGMGVDPSTAEAYFWYSLAGRQDDKDAAVKATSLESELPTEALVEVKARLASWKAQTTKPAANVVSVSDPQWQPAAASAPEPRKGAQNDIFRTQELLAKLGFSIGTPDGKMGSRTANAIRLFELQQGLKVTGQVSPELLSKLESKSG